VAYNWKSLTKKGAENDLSANFLKGCDSLSTNRIMHGGETMIKGRAVLTVLLGCVMVMAIVMFGMTGMADAGAVKISSSEFTSDGDSAQFAYVKPFIDGTIVANAFACLVAPVKIPGTATKITKLTVYLTDDGVAAIRPQFRLTRMKPTDGTTTDYATTFVTNGTSVVQGILVPLLGKNITKGQNISLGLCIDAGQVFYGAKVNYQ